MRAQRFQLVLVVRRPNVPPCESCGQHRPDANLDAQQVASVLSAMVSELEKRFGVSLELVNVSQVDN